MKEFKDIPGYEGYYKVSSEGDVVSVPRKIWNGHSHFISKEKYLKPNTLAKGYFQVTLNNGQGRKSFQVHRLVAMAFIPNPEGLPQVNHKDGNKQNNKVENLEWCDNAMNQIHAYKIGLQKSHIAGRPMRQVILTKGGEEIRFKCIADATKFIGSKKKYHSQMARVLNPKETGYKTIKGYAVRYAD